MTAQPLEHSYHQVMADDSGKLQVEGLSQDDPNVLRENGLDASALARDFLYAEAERLRAAERLPPPHDPRGRRRAARLR